MHLLLKRILIERLKIIQIHVSVSKTFRVMMPHQLNLHQNYNQLLIRAQVSMTSMKKQMKIATMKAHTMKYQVKILQMLLILVIKLLTEVKEYHEEGKLKTLALMRRWWK